MQGSAQEPYLVIVCDRTLRHTDNCLNAQATSKKKATTVMAIVVGSTHIGNGATFALLLPQAGGTEPFFVNLKPPAAAQPVMPLQMHLNMRDTASLHADCCSRLPAKFQSDLAAITNAGQARTSSRSLRKKAAKTKESPEPISMFDFLHVFFHSTQHPHCTFS